MQSRFAVPLALAMTASLLAGCDSFRDAAGIGKDAPDEFAVLTKAPLVIPPEYNLRPPRPGAAPTNQTEPTQAAQSALFNADPSVVAANMSGDYSQAEKLLLANAGAANADPSIRAQLASDGKSMQGTDDDFANQVLFWQKPTPDTGTNVDADAEAKRVDAQKNAGQPSTAKPANADIQKEPKSGWLDGIF